jgi:hypothetical protein
MAVCRGRRCVLLGVDPERQAEGQPLGSVLLCATIAFREKNQ